MTLFLKELNVKLRKKCIVYSIHFLMLCSVSSFAQNTDQDTTRFDPRFPIYPNEAKAGEFTPGKGFLMAKNKFASLNISIYAMARYINQLPAKQTWTDHQGVERTFAGRNDIFWQRSALRRSPPAPAPERRLAGP